MCGNHQTSHKQTGTPWHGEIILVQKRNIRMDNDIDDVGKIMSTD
jgi:hypothetical protein